MSPHMSLDRLVISLPLTHGRTTPKFGLPLGFPCLVYTGGYRRGLLPLPLIATQL